MPFRARWSPALMFVTLLVTLICVVAALAGARAVPWLGPLLLAMPVVASLFSVLGYRLEDDTLLIRRPLWSNRVALRGLRSAVHDPQLVKGSWRTFGNGGFFSISGWFYNRTLGKYRALVTSREDIVVLRFEDRVLVISPSPPQAFVAALSTRLPGAG